MQVIDFHLVWFQQYNNKNLEYSSLSNIRDLILLYMLTMTLNMFPFTEAFKSLWPHARTPYRIESLSKIYDGTRQLFLIQPSKFKQKCKVMLLLTAEYPFLSPFWFSFSNKKFSTKLFNFAFKIQVNNLVLTQTFTGYMPSKINLRGF